MEIGKRFRGGVERTNRKEISGMVENLDCPGLIDSIDNASPGDVTFILEKLTELSEIGWNDTIITYGALPKISMILNYGDQAQRRAAALLVYSLIVHGKGDLTLSVGGLLEGMIGQLETDDDGLRRCVAYTMSVLAPMNSADRMVAGGVIERFVPLVESHDQQTLVYTLSTLHTLSSQGYRKVIRDAGIHVKIRYHMDSGEEVSILAKSILDDIYDLDEGSFEFDQQDPEVIPENLETIGLEDGYIRPGKKGERIDPRDGKFRSMHGNEIIDDEEDEEILIINTKKKEDQVE